MAEMKARITLEDYVSEPVTKIIEAFNNLQNTMNIVSNTKLTVNTSNATQSIQNVQSAMQSVSRQNLNVNTTGAMQSVQSVQNAFNSLNRNIPKPVITAVNNTNSVINTVKNGLNGLAKSPTTIAIKAKDEITAVISKIKEALMSLKTLALTIVLGATFKETIGAASQLEQEQIAMKHFIGYNNQKSSTTDVQKMTDDYISKLRVEANATPFSTNEIIAAGRRAVNVTSGDTKQAMDLVKLSENMAALNPGKSVMDAMEALADAQEIIVKALIYQLLKLSFYAIMKLEM
jgi:hypothetical protein